MFRLLDQTRGPLVDIHVEGRILRAVEGDNLAAALLTADLRPFRTTPVGGVPREPYCMMGVCFDCLAVIDGHPNRQTCLETVRAGMTVERQCGAPEIGDGQ